MRKILLSLFAATLACHADVARVMMPERYEVGDQNVKAMQPIDQAAWIWKPGTGDNTFLLFKKEFTATEKTCRIHVSADERFVLKLDGKIVARGPHRGTVARWAYQSYDLKLAPGRHTLEAICWRIGDNAPFAQLSWLKTGGFILKAEGDYDAQLSTGKAQWLVGELGAPVWHGYPRGFFFACARPCDMKGNSPFGETPANFAPAQVVRGPITYSGSGCEQMGWRLFPSSLPDMGDSAKRIAPGRIVAARTSVAGDVFFAQEDTQHPAVAQWNDALRTGGTVVVPAGSELQVLWNLDNYFCAYPFCNIKGGKGAKIEWSWAESLRDGKFIKQNRDAFAGMKFDERCLTDSLSLEGGEALFALPWWRSGKWCRIAIKTADEPVELSGISLEETHCPLPIVASFSCDDPTLDAVQKICVRGMEMCSHETGMDCPFYEQLMYPGDTRLQLLIHNVLECDDTVVRREIELFDFSRAEDGRVGMSFPQRRPQDSWTYTLCWVLMLDDYAMWHENTDWLRVRLVGLRHTMAGLKLHENEDGLLENLPGWNFMDWVPGWRAGCAPDGNKNSSINNLFYVAALRAAAHVEDLVGEKVFADFYRKEADERASKIVALFWNEEKGMLADDVAKTKFSEHALSLALTLDVLPPEKAKRVEKALLEEPDLARCTVYFAHYLFDAYAKIGRNDLFLKRLDLWRGYVKDGMCTPLEMPGNARSDCHAWGSHPLYHLHANIAGVKPSSPGYKTVRVAPQPGGLKRITSATATAKGLLKQELVFDGEKVSGSVELPKGLTGEFVWKNKAVPLHEGRQDISL